MTQESSVKQKEWRFKEKLVLDKRGLGELFDVNGDDDASGPVACLGMTFENDAARREHFLNLLREHLRDPKFRNIEGFPDASDDAILAISDPPYFTICPNPWTNQILDHWRDEVASHQDDSPYPDEPFAADVSEGKYDPIYKYHPYPTKVPHKAIMRYILYYTKPGDVVLDGFCGTGMSGVAAQLCGDKDAVESLGYRVDSDGRVTDPHADSQSFEVQSPKMPPPFSAIGSRRAVLNDLSPVAAFISYNYNTLIDITSFERRMKAALDIIEEECGWMFETSDSEGRVGRINYMVWSDVFVCPACGGEIVFWNEAVNIESGKVKNEFHCPHCNATMTKRRLERRWETSFDKALNETVRQAKQIPVLINYSVGKKRYQKPVDASDLKLLRIIEETDIDDWFPTTRLPDGCNTRQPINSHGFSHVHHFYSRRNMCVLAKLRSRCTDPRDLLMITKVAFQISKLYRFTYQSGVWGAGGGPLSGTLYIPSLVKELNIIKQLTNALKSRSKVSPRLSSGSYVGAAGSSTTLVGLPDNCIDYVFLDPPFGANLNYSELAILSESWLKVRTNNQQEAIENVVQGKGPNEYRQLMSKCFQEVYRVLKPGRWMTVEFSNTQASVWNSIQTALAETGFDISNVAALDKQKKTFKAVTTPTAAKQDLIISARKPLSGSVEKLKSTSSTSESVWDFVRNHLQYIPVTKVEAGKLVPVPERDPRLLFNQMVAYYVRGGYPVPLSSQEFQSGLANRFRERDGMYFLAEQALEYDRKQDKTVR